MKTVLLTGGAGYIGSHTAVELINAGYNIIIVDDLSNSSIDVIDKIIKITNDPAKISFYPYNISSELQMRHIFDTNVIDIVIHFAAFKAVGESTSNPLKYYKNNVSDFIIFLNMIKEYKIKNIVFSSSATVYGIPKSLPLSEQSDINILNPYGQTKFIGETILTDWVKADNSLNVVILRYFNPVGAHKSGLIGESPKDIPNNLFPYILDVIRGKQTHLNVFGSDYDTKDGTGVRDYIHVVDLAKGHLSALDILENNNKKGITVYNLGTGKGYSVLDIVDTFNKFLSENNKDEIKYKLTERRQGDSPIVYADVRKANDELGWSAKFGLDEMVMDSLNFLGLNFY